MDICFIDITVEFLAVAFHNILYYSSVYPPSIFDMRKKYGIIVYRAKHPEVNQYIDLCLKSVAECLKSGTLKRVEFALTDERYNPLAKYVFDFDKDSTYDENTDAYLIQAEQNLRAFCLNLVKVSNKLHDMPDNKSFSVFLHTNESTAVAMTANPDLDDFPLIEVEDKVEEMDKILPLRRFPLRGYHIDVYVETQ